jgi:hypothetical protein
VVGRLLAHDPHLRLIAEHLMEHHDTRMLAGGVGPRDGCLESSATAGDYLDVGPHQRDHGSRQHREFAAATRTPA